MSVMYVSNSVMYVLNVMFVMIVMWVNVSSVKDSVIL